MEENLLKLQKFSTVVVFAVELEVTYDISIFVEFVLEKKQMLENFQVLENHLGKKQGKIKIY
jgi:hypothetical protein